MGKLFLWRRGDTGVSFRARSGWGGVPLYHV
nr:MAG TPA: hypothetical protein [Caudoviricetes sp.]